MVGSMGDERAIIAYPIVSTIVHTPRAPKILIDVRFLQHGGKDYACQWYGPDDGPDGHYGDPAVSNVNSLAKPEHQT